MPLIILGLIVIASIVAYAIINGGDDGNEDTRSVRERYAHMFEDRAKDATEELSKQIRRRAGIHDADFTVEDDGYGGPAKDPDDNTIQFPSDVESAKRQRDIH